MFMTCELQLTELVAAECAKIGNHMAGVIETVDIISMTITISQSATCIISKLKIQHNKETRFQHINMVEATARLNEYADITGRT